MTLASEILFGYQVEAAERIASQTAVLLADQPGLGKTLEVLGGLELAGLFAKPSNVLILTPIINAQTTWIDTLERFLRPRYDFTIIDLSRGTAVQKSKALQSAGAGINFYVANHNAIDVSKNGMRVDVTSIYFDAVIVDESHLVLPITRPKLTQFWKGLSKIRMYSGTRRIAISGTPDRGKLENRFGTWSFLYPEIAGTNRYKWLEENFFMVEQKVSYNRTIKVPYKLKDERLWQLYSNKWMIRRTKQEVLSQLPAKRYVDVELELSGKQKLAYFVAQMDYEKSLRDDAEANQAALLFSLRSRQLATCSWSEDYANPIVGGESAKLAWLLEWLDERGFIESDSMADNQAQVVIVSQFSKVLHWLEKELKNVGIDCAVLDGGTSPIKRVSIQGQFQAGQLRVCLLSGTMGVGINLDRADDLIMLDSPYDPDRLEQIEDRIHRASSNHQVTIWNLVSSGTIDQAIAEKVSKRYQTTRKLLDEDRGVEIGRNVLAIVRKVREMQEIENG